MPVFLLTRDSGHLPWSLILRVAVEGMRRSVKLSIMRRG